MKSLYLISVWVHILAVAVWLGGMVFLALALVPILRRTQKNSTTSRLIHWTGQRFRWIGWVSLTLLVLSGAFNLVYRGYGWTDVWDGTLWQGSFGRTLAIKLFLVALVLAFSALHDFVVGPRATELMKREPASESTRQTRLAASWLGRINLILALVIVMLGVILVRGGW